MNDQERKAALLRERARKLAARELRTDRRMLHERVVLLSIAGERFGIPAAQLREVIRATKITPLPGLPSFMPGIACVRGEIVSVIDLAALRDRDAGKGAAFFALIEAGSRRLALLAELILGVEDVFEDELTDDLVNAQARAAFTRAVTKDLVQLLDVAGLFRSPRLLAGAPAPAAAREDG